MIITRLINYYYPQNGIIVMKTELGEFTKFEGIVEMTKDGIKFWSAGKQILAKQCLYI